MRRGDILKIFNLRERLAGFTKPDRGVEHKDKLGGYPNRSSDHHEDRYRGDRLVVRVLGISLLATIIAVICLVNLFSVLLPLEKLTPIAFQSFSQDRQIVRAEALVRSSTAYELALESAVLDYIQLRFELIPNAKLMDERWGETSRYRQMQTKELYEAFVAEAKQYRYIQSAVERSLTRRVRFVSDPLKVSEGYYTIDFELVDTEKGYERRQQWTARVLVEGRARQVAFKDRYVNPLGIEILDFTYTSKR